MELDTGLPADEAVAISSTAARGSACTDASSTSELTTIKSPASSFRSTLHATSYTIAVQLLVGRNTIQCFDPVIKTATFCFISVGDPVRRGVDVLRYWVADLLGVCEIYSQ